MPSKLLRAQWKFSRMLPRLIDKAHELGYEVTGGDWMRDHRCPYGSKTSAHRERLAVDLNLFKDGEYLTRTENHLALGTWWELQGGIWGGRFSEKDGNHYEWPKYAL